MESQHELFEDLPRAADPRGNFAEFRVGRKIVQVPLSFWKDGRTRADLSEFGAGEVVSRNEANLQERVIHVLRECFGTIVEAVCEEFAQARARKPSHPRLNNKRAVEETAITPKRYINPFEQDIWKFSKAPRWLLVRREPSPTEKLVYARLTYSPREKEEEKICRKDVRLGLIFELDQAKLATELGVRRESVCAALKSLKKRGLIEYTGGPGAKGGIRFLWHPWMDETCAFNTQVVVDQPVRSDHRSCAKNAQPAVTLDHRSCAKNAQVSLVSESIERKEKERGRSHSRQW
jgi:Crp-like helix-turn-helix domain